MTLRPRPHLALPLGVAAILTGAALLALLMDHPRVAVAVVILTLVLTLAILSELIFGER